MEVEFIICWDCGSWGTYVITVPKDLYGNDQAVVEWVRDHSGFADSLSDAAYIAVYNWEPNE